MKVTSFSGVIPLLCGMTTANTYIKIYTSLGYLFYSVAAGDGTVRTAEVDELKRLVKEKWLPLEGSRDEFGTDAAHYIEMSFDFALGEEMDGEEAYERFTDEYPELAPHFDAGLKRTVRETAAAIADAFYGTNKEEQKHLEQIGRLLA